ncbi:MAG: nucleoside recognition protein [Bacillota bacterium]|nr:nucleoside recognition protein [Bacillota bacterium]
MINAVWALLLLAGMLFFFIGGRFQEAGEAAINSVKSAVELMIGMCGAYCLWMGVLGIARKAGLVEALAKRSRKLLCFLFPTVPAESEAMGYIALNLIANILGMGNAATPFGLRAMEELAKLQDCQGRATDAMLMLVIINNSAIQLLPIGTIALRAAFSSADPYSIMLTTLISTTCNTLLAVAAAKLIQRRRQKCRR